MKNMNTNINFDEYEDMYDYIDEDLSNRMRRKNAKANSQEKTKRKGHQSKHGDKDKWDSLEEDYLDVSNILTNTTEIVRPANKNKLLDNARAIATTAQTTASTPSNNKAFTTSFNFGPNSHEVKGNMIDFDKVIDIQKVENDYNGKNTFGIKFFFSGKKGLYRIAWYSQNARERNAAYEKEYAYWKSLSANN